MKCAKCEIEAVIKQGHQHLCPKHYRFGQMRVNAKRSGKSVPSHDHLHELVTDEMICIGCNRTMNWRRVEGKSTVATLQHNRDGTFAIICLSCNTRHAQMEGDSFYKHPKDKKTCSSCKEILPLDSFATDNNKRWMNKKSTCRSCCGKSHAIWAAKNRESYNEKRRMYYHLRKKLGNPIPRKKKS